MLFYLGFICIFWKEKILIQEIVKNNKQITKQIKHEKAKTKTRFIKIWIKNKKQNKWKNKIKKSSAIRTCDLTVGLNRFMVPTRT